MTILDAFTIVGKINEAKELIKNQAVGEVVTLPPIKQKLWGKRKRITIYVENGD